MKNRFNYGYLYSLIKKNKKKGFTLIELLFVITVTGVIPSVAIPLLLNYYNFPQAQITSQIKYR